MKKGIVLVAAMATLAGCASSTGIVAVAVVVVVVGKDVFMVVREDNGPTASLCAIKAATFKDASAFCAGQGKIVRSISESDTPRALGQFPQTTLRFACD